VEIGIKNIKNILTTYQKDLGKNVILSGGCTPRTPPAYVAHGKCAPPRKILKKEKLKNHPPSPPPSQKKKNIQNKLAYVIWI